jgi:hypothetical protein
MLADTPSVYNVRTAYYIHYIQGASHLSPLNGAISNVNGIVTAKRTNGFYRRRNRIA